MALLLKSQVNFVRLLNRCQRDVGLLQQAETRAHIDAADLSVRVTSLATLLQALTSEAAALWSQPSAALCAPTRAQLATFERAVKQLREFHASFSLASADASSSSATSATSTTSSSASSVASAVVGAPPTTVVESVLRLDRAKERDARDELLGVRERRRTAARAAAETAMSAGELEGQLQEQERLQATYKRELARLAAVLKEAALQQATVVKGGNVLIDNLGDSVGENRERIIAENKRLKEHTESWGSGMLFYWIVLVFSMLAFVGTVLVIKIVPK
jgi:hypothetical protein